MNGPRAVERAVDALSGPSQPDLVYGDCAFLDVAGQFLGYFESVHPFSRWELLNYSDFIPQPRAFFRRSAYEAVGGLDPRPAYAMDGTFGAAWPAEAPSLRASLNETRATDATATQGTATAHWEFGRPTHFTHVDLSVHLDESNGLGSRLRFEWA